MADISRIRVDSTTYDLKDARLPAPGADGTTLVADDGAWTVGTVGGDSPVESGTGAGSVQSKQYESYGSTYVQAATANGATALGGNTIASGGMSLAEGSNTKAQSLAAHSEGDSTQAGYLSHAEGDHSIAWNEAHAEGTYTVSNYSHSEGRRTAAYAPTDGRAHAEGNGWYYELTPTAVSEDVVTFESIPSEVNDTCNIVVNPDTGVVYRTTSVDHSNNQMTFDSAYGEIVGHTLRVYSQGIAYGRGAHAEGYCCKALFDGSHAEGMNTTSIAAHSEGLYTQANGAQCHAEGDHTIATGTNQHVQGKYNIEDTNNTYAHIVGNGTNTARSNAHTLDWNGNAWYAGTVSAGTVANPATVTNANDLTTKAYVDANAGGDSPVESGTGVGSAQTKSYLSGSSNSPTAFQRAEGIGSFANGAFTYAKGKYSLAEGFGTVAEGPSSHAEGGGSPRMVSITGRSGTSTLSYGSLSGFGGFKTNERTPVLIDLEHGYTYYVSSIDRTNNTLTITTSLRNNLTSQPMLIRDGYAAGEYSHIEGQNNITLQAGEHAEGYQNIVNGFFAHGEGYNTYTDGRYAHTEGSQVITHAEGAHAEGYRSPYGTSLYLTGSDGTYTYTGNISDVKPGDVVTEYYANQYPNNRFYGFVRSIDTSNHTIVIDGVTGNPVENFWVAVTHGYAGGDYSHVEGDSSGTRAICSHAEGNHTMAGWSDYDADSDQYTYFGDASHTEGSYTQTIANTSHAEGSHSTAGGFTCDLQYSEEGDTATSYKSVYGDASHAEGYHTQTFGNFAHAGGNNARAIGEASFAQGYQSLTYGDYSTSFAENSGAVSSFMVEIASGDISTCTYTCSIMPSDIYINKGQILIAETDKGLIARKVLDKNQSTNTIVLDKALPTDMLPLRMSTGYGASGISSLCEGYATISGGNYSHAEGVQTIASGKWQHVSGRANIVDTNDDYAVIVGNGTIDEDDDNRVYDAMSRSNAYTLDWSGNGWFAGNITANGGSLTLHDSTGDVTITAAQLRQLLAMLS